MKSITEVELRQAIANVPEIIVFDTETTGLDPVADRVIQISAIRFSTNELPDGTFKEIDRLNLYIRPPFEVSEFIEDLTGITNAQLSKENDEDECFPLILKYFGEKPAVAAYNSPFDIAYMKELYKRHGREFSPSFNIDILKCAREILPKSKVVNHKQATVAEYYGMADGVQFHNSMADTEIAFKLLTKFYGIYKAGRVCEKEFISIYRAYYHENVNYGQRLIYVITNIGKIFFNVCTYTWGEPQSQKGVLARIDVPKLEKDLFRRYDCNCYKDLVHTLKAM